jgi:hypothetical protein
MSALKQMVDRFLAWELPKDFQPDGGVSFRPPRVGWPVGTNLLTAEQATAMFRHCLEVPRLNKLDEILDSLADNSDMTPEQIARRLREDGVDLAAFHARMAQRQPVDPAPAKPRRMKGNPKSPKESYHGGEHDEIDACREAPACQPVDPAPEFEAEVHKVAIDDDGNCYPISTGVGAQVGTGTGDGYTIAAFCETKEDADALAQSFCEHGRLSVDIDYWDFPLKRGRRLPFAVAVKVVTK